MSEQETLAAAIKNLNLGEYNAAEEKCREVLAVDPQHAKAWHLCGVTQAQQGRFEQAQQCFENATRFDPNSSAYLYNLALAHKALGNLEEAIASYRAAIDLRHDFLEARSNLGNALMAAGDNYEATKAFRELVELFPMSSDAHYNFANSLQETGNFEDAIIHYRRALEIEPSRTMARENLGRAFVDEGLVDEAKEVWETWLKREPSNSVARHLLASLSGENPPPRCDDDYIRNTFDQAFANSFDQKLERLEYRAPELVGEAFHSTCDEKSKSRLWVLDAGCGTGLCGPIFRPVADYLVGVDLSEEMLVEAQKRNVYDEAVAAEITGYMAAHLSTMDLIVSADTLCYFGELSEVLRAAFACLKPNGRMIFTVESIPLDPPVSLEPPVSLDEAAESPSSLESDRSCDPPIDYKLLPHGRYCHSESYVAKSLRHAGFDTQQITPAVLRKERGVPVNGFVVTACRERLDRTE